MNFHILIFIGGVAASRRTWLDRHRVAETSVCVWGGGGGGPDPVKVPADPHGAAAAGQVPPPHPDTPLLPPLDPWGAPDLPRGTPDFAV